MTTSQLLDQLGDEIADLESAARKRELIHEDFGGADELYRRAEELRRRSDFIVDATPDLDYEDGMCPASEMG